MKKILLLSVIALSMTSCGFNTINEGYRGIKTTFGKVDGDPKGPGLHFYNPITSSMFEMDVREHRWEATENCFTADTQNVSLSYVMTAFPEQDKIAVLYSQFGMEWDKKIVPQVIQTSIKDVVGQYKADDLVGKREVARQTAFEQLKAALKARMVTVTRLDFTNIDFNEQYEKAVEDKVVAVQRAAEAKNKTVQTKEEAEQKIVTAKAEAEAMRIKSQALSQNKGLVSYEAVQKWDGKLPVNMYGSAPLPFLNIKQD